MNRLHILFLAWCTISLSAIAQRTEMEHDMFETMRDDDKAVIVAVHAAADDAESKNNVERFNAQLRQAYPAYDFREACTSKGTMQQVPSPDELFSQLQKDGYTHVLVQSSSITNDIDMQYLRQSVEAAKNKFKHLRLGEPLLNERDDYEEVVKVAMATFNRPKEVNVIVCNGTEGVADAQYTMLDYTLRNRDAHGWFVATIDGFPSLEALIKQIKRSKIKRVHLIPFALTEGAKISQALQGEWTRLLQQAGFKVTTDLRNMGDMDAIIEIFKNHMRHAEKFRTLTAKEQKLMLR